MPLPAENAPGVFVRQVATIRFTCQVCGIARNVEPDEAAAFKIPTCNQTTCNSYQRKMSQGTLLYDVLPPKPPAPLPLNPKEQRHLLRTPLYEHFCAVLDAIRVRMGGGGFTERFCVACEEKPHAGPRACQCACHAAWRERHELEAARL